jgi:disulfide oxidoreductase YuzD
MGNRFIMENNVEIIVYGAEQLCTSCVHLPSSKETYEWLKAAISRKFPEQPFQISYVDIYNPPADLTKQKFVERVIEEDMFYPVIVIGDKIVGEGNPRLKMIFSELERYGYKTK